jgi:hypothetical protein
MLEVVIGLQLLIRTRVDRGGNMAAAVSTPNQTKGVDLVHSAIRVAPSATAIRRQPRQYVCAATVMGIPNSQTPLPATTELLQINFNALWWAWVGDTSLSQPATAPIWRALVC